MEMLIQLLISGIATGSIYAILALGFVLVYKASGVLNIAQGEMFMLGTLVSFACISQLGLPMWLVLIITLIFGAVLGVVLQYVVIRPLIGEPLMTMVMATIGLMVVLKGFGMLVWDGLTLPYPAIFPKAVISVGEFNLLSEQVSCFIAALVIFAIFFLFFQYTKSGLEMRAVAEGYQACRSMGIRVRNVFAMSWLIAGVSAAMAGIVYGDTIGNVSVMIGELGLVVLSVVLVGGLDSIPGTIVAGIIIGVTQNLACGYLDPLILRGVARAGSLRTVFPYIVMITVLMFRPYGLLGLRRIERI